MTFILTFDYNFSKSMTGVHLLHHQGIPYFVCILWPLSWPLITIFVKAWLEYIYCITKEYHILCGCTLGKLHVIFYFDVSLTLTFDFRLLKINIFILKNVFCTLWIWSFTKFISCVKPIFCKIFGSTSAKVPVPLSDFRWQYIVVKVQF